MAGSQNKVYLGADTLMLNLTAKTFDENVSQMDKNKK